MTDKHPFCLDCGTSPGPGPSPGCDCTAKDIDYDNTSSGIPATNVQDAIDHIASSGGGCGSGIESVDTLDDLRAVASVDLDDDSIYLVQETGHLWKYEANTGANEIDDSNLSVKPDDVLQANNGRWRPVISHGKPGISAGPVTVPTSYLPAGLNIIGAKPVVDGSPEGPSVFAGFAVDRGDTAGVKNPYPILGLNDNGKWVLAELDMSTLQVKDFYEFKDNEFAITTYPTDGAKKIVVRTRSGFTTYTSDDLDLSIEAASTNQDSIIQAGNLTLKGGDHIHHDGIGGYVLIKPGKSGISAGRTGGIVALCDEDGDQVVAVAKDHLAFFGGTLTEKPTVTGNWTDGTANQNLIYALESLGLLTDNTEGPFAWPVYMFDEIDFSIYNDTVIDTPYPIPGTGAEYVRVSEIGFYLSTQIQGTGDIEIKVGTTYGGAEVILAKNINSTTTPSSNVAGFDISTLGPAWPASTGYTLEMKPNDLVWPTITVPSGITGGKLRFYIKGVAYK